MAERDLVQAGEGQAPLEAEDLDAVRLMTVHRAKGLEFPLVCVADLGKLGREDDAALRVTEDGRTGMRLASMSGESVNTAEMDRIKEEQKAADEEEERRIFYVATTRAEEHLVLSGATDLEKLQEPADLAEPMRWIWRALAPRLDEMENEGVVTGEYEGREVRVALPRAAPRRRGRAAARRRPPAGGARARAAGPRGAGGARAGRGARCRAALPVSRLSYSGLAAYHRCGYRFYLEKALRLPPPDDGPARAARGGDAGDALRAHRPRHGGARAAGGAGLRGARGARRTQRMAEVIESIGEPVREDEVADMREHGRRLRGLAAGGAHRRRRAGAGRAAVRLHAGHGRRSQPADRRHRGRARP